MIYHEKLSVHFFYGTLRLGWWNHDRVVSAGSRFMGQACTVGKFTMLVSSGRIPCIFPNPDGVRIVGEVWALTPEDAEACQLLERGYERTEIQVSFQTEGRDKPGPFPARAGDLRMAYAYFARSRGDVPLSYFRAEDRAVEVKSGDYEDAVPKTERWIAKREVA